MYTDIQNGVEKQDIFNYLNRYRCEVELPAQLERMVRFPGIVSVKENLALAGHAFFANGPGLFKRWQEEGIIYGFACTSDVGSARTYDDFKQYMDTHGREDGASIIDSGSGLIYRVTTLPRMIEKLSKEEQQTGSFITNRLPPHYKSRNEEKTPLDKVGNRTILALSLTAYEPKLHAFITSQTPWDEYGMGLNSWFNHEGIVATAFFQKNATTQKPTQIVKQYQPNVFTKEKQAA